MANKSAYVLDTFALLAYPKDERGEVFYIVEHKGGVPEAQDALALI